MIRVRKEGETVSDKCGIAKLGMWLKIWAFIRVIADVMGIGYLGIVSFFLMFGRGSDVTKMPIFHLMVLLILGLIFDLGFIIILIAGLFKQSYSILRMIFFYEMYAIAALATLIPVSLYMIYTTNPYFGGTVYYIGMAVVGVLIVLVEACVFLSVKSMMIQLRNRKTGSVRVPDEDEFDL